MVLVSTDLKHIDIALNTTKQTRWYNNKIDIPLNPVRAYKGLLTKNIKQKLV